MFNMHKIMASSLLPLIVGMVICILSPIVVVVHCNAINHHPFHPKITTATYTLERINFIEETMANDKKEKPKSTMLVALIEIGFDQPMYIYGNHSLSLSNIQKTKSLLKNICELKCYDDKSSLKNDKQLDDVVIEFNAKNASSPLGLSPIPHSIDKTAALLPFTSNAYFAHGSMRTIYIYIYTYIHTY